MLGLVLLIGQAALFAVAAQAQTGASDAPTPTRVENSTECWRHLVRDDILDAAPSMCWRRIHWIVGVDVSRSTIGRGGWHDKMGEMLMHWAKYTTAREDRVTLITFAHDLRIEGTVDIDDKPKLQAWIGNHIGIRPPPTGHPGGTALPQARKRALEAACAADHKKFVILTMVFADRIDEDTGGQPILGPEGFPEPAFLKAFGRKMGPYEPGSRRAESASGPPIGAESLAFYQIVKEGEPCRIYCFYSVSKKAASLPRGPLNQRYIPPSTAQRAVPPAEEVDWRAVVRRIVTTLIIGLLLVLGGIAVACSRRNQTGNVQMSGGRKDFRWWRPWQPHREPIRASANVPGLRVRPARPDLKDPVIAGIEVDAWSLKPWRATLMRFRETDYQFRLGNVEDDRRIWGEQVWIGDGTVEPSEPKDYVLEVRSSTGDVGRGRVQYRMDRRMFGMVKYLLWTAIAILILAVVGPIAVGLTPAPAPPIIERPRPEPLCRPSISVHRDALGELREMASLRIGQPPMQS